MSQFDLPALVAQLTIEEKVALVSGADFWSTTPIERIGLRAMVLSDGPSGVRGPIWDERSPSLNLPNGSALGASWDTALARRYGAAAAAEARRKGVDVVLGPTINLQRSPLGGRHFEAFSEDPRLTADLTAAYVAGLQSMGVAATPKHYVANDSETDRYTLNVQVSPQALHECYLLPFEAAVAAGTWAIMSSYNSVDGVTMTENTLLTDPLRTQWGYDGVVVSDWTAVRSLDAARADQDLAMPGPAPAWSDTLLAAVKAGQVPEALIDTKVLRLLRLAQRVGALRPVGTAPPAPVDPLNLPATPYEAVAFAERAAIEGTVLLANRGELPWQPAALSRVAVIGQGARQIRTQGGGSATVVPAGVVTPLAALRAALPGVQVDYALGVVSQEGLAPLAPERLANPVTGGPGLRAVFTAADGAEVLVEDRFAAEIIDLGGAGTGPANGLTLHTLYTPEADGVLQLGFAASLHGRVWVDGQLVLDATPQLAAEGQDLGAAFLSPPWATAPVEARAGVALEIKAQFTIVADDGPLAGVLAVTLGLAPAPVGEDESIAEAAALAAASDVAVVVVGTNAKVESEGFDRTSLALPGRQDDLVRAVAAANPHTVVVVNAGSPVLLPWRDQVAAVLMGYFGGQAAGSALAGILLGLEEPGGRLPTTWPAGQTDVPVLNVTPDGAGQLAYAEGVHIGYRAWLKAGTAPAYPFGHGLGYTTWELGPLAVTGSAAADDVRATVSWRNSGARAGKQVIQVYAERPGSAVDRPVRWLVGWAVVRAAAGETGQAVIKLPRRAFAHWQDGTWAYEPGRFTLRAGTSVAELPLAATIEL
ncbi:MAG: glycoside hydrolase family 3 C-terminal domain-containing protein [Bifidobacteriaceae bacterium]|jgi:beta-glucosidase|nr:glycoside hydrolase family 3 C-terminal domain-containing protein [Bifidobacteriaceae bacterium]